MDNRLKKINIRNGFFGLSLNQALTNHQDHHCYVLKAGSHHQIDTLPLSLQNRHLYIICEDLTNPAVITGHFSLEDCVITLKNINLHGQVNNPDMPIILATNTQVGLTNSTISGLGSCIAIKATGNSQIQLDDCRFSDFKGSFEDDQPACGLMLEAQTEAILTNLTFNRYNETLGIVAGDDARVQLNGGKFDSFEKSIAIGLDDQASAALSDLTFEQINTDAIYMKGGLVKLSNCTLHSAKQSHNL